MPVRAIEIRENPSLRRCFPEPGATVHFLNQFSAAFGALRKIYQISIQTRASRAGAAGTRKRNYHYCGNGGDNSACDPKPKHSVLLADIVAYLDILTRQKPPCKAVF